LPDDQSANLSRAWQAAAPAGGTLGAAVGAAVGGGAVTAEGAGDGAAGATVGTVVVVEVGADAGAAVADDATGVDVMVGAGVPAAGDEVELASVPLGTTVVVFTEQATIRAIPATFHRRRIASRLDASRCVRRTTPQADATRLDG